jgi:hypothetical protein
MSTPFSSFVPDEPGQPDLNTVSGVDLRPVNYNDTKFLEEDPKLIDHMDNRREQYLEEENKKRKKVFDITNEDLANIMAANDKINVNFASLVKNLDQSTVNIDDCLENSFRHVNAITDILNHKKPPVGFQSLDSKHCFTKLLEFTTSLSDKLQLVVKNMGKLNIELNQFKKNDELFRSELIKRFNIPQNTNL